MNTKLIIDRLKTNALTFQGRVSGAAEFTADVEATRLPVPSAYVMRSGGEGSDDAALGATVQMLNEDFAIVICVDNSKDPLGYDADQKLDVSYWDVMAAVLGWTSTADQNAFVFVRDDHVGFDRSRLWHQMVFRTTRVISSLSP